MNIDFDINEVTSDILGMIWEKLVELDGETGPISGVTTLFLRSFHDVISAYLSRYLNKENSLIRYIPPV